jgi:AraC family transcriptional regulator
LRVMQMKNNNEMLGRGPYPDLNHMNLYHSGGVGLVVPKTRLVLLKGQHVHNSYEFLVPFNDIISNKIEKRYCLAQKNKIFPFNSEQYHGPERDIEDISFIAVLADKLVLNNIAKTIYGKSDVVFKNQNFEYDFELSLLISQFIGEWEQTQPGYRFILESLSVQILINLLRKIKHNLLGETTKSTTNEIGINRVVEFLQENYNRDYSFEEVAKIANLSPFHFIRFFKNQTGKTPYDFLLDIKINRAKEMLENKIYTITEVSISCGFNNVSHFSTLFKKRVGVTPSQYRNQVNV